MIQTAKCPASIAIALLLLALLLTGCAAPAESALTPPPVVESTPEPAPQPTFRVLTPESGRIDFAVYSEGIFMIYDRAGTYDFMAEDGTDLTKVVYEYAYPFSEGMACVRRNGKYGFINTSGILILPLVYDNATSFVEGLAYFEQGDKYGFITPDGEVAFWLDCDSVSSFQEGRAFFFDGGKYGYYDSTGAIAIEAVFDDAGFFSEGVAKVRIGDGFGLIDRNGDFVLEPIYEDVTLDDGYIRIQIDGRVGLLNRAGEMVLAPEYGSIEVEPALNAAKVRRDDSVQLIGLDDAGRQSAVYDGIYYYGERIRASAGEEQYYLNPRDFSETDQRYTKMNRVPVGTDLVITRTEEGVRLTNGLGKPLSDIVYDRIQHCGDGFMVERDGRCGFLDRDGQRITTRIYDYCADWKLLDMENCLVGHHRINGKDSIIVMGALEEIDLSQFVLRNEITPRQRSFSEFLRNGSIVYDSPLGGDGEWSVGELQRFLQFYKLYQMDDGLPLIYYYARPIMPSMMQESFSGFYLAEDEGLVQLLRGYECGGSMGGDYVCFWRDRETGEILIGEYYHFGGFGGQASGGRIYRYANGAAERVVARGGVWQTTSNYNTETLLATPELFYDSNHQPYTRETMEQAKENRDFITEYEINDERVDIETYDAVAAQHSLYALWTWPGY